MAAYARAAISRTIGLGTQSAPNVKHGTDNPRVPPPPRKPSGAQKRKQPHVVNWCSPVFTKDSKLDQEPTAKQVHQMFVVTRKTKGEVQK